MEDLKLVAKGAEADLWLDPDWNGVKALIKRRGESTGRGRPASRRPSSIRSTPRARR
jgi:hypothetical protein